MNYDQELETGYLTCKDIGFINICMGNALGPIDTMTHIPKLVNMQREIAQKNKVAFWDLYDAMGGRNAIVNWVEGDTVFAYRDYMHVNAKGAKKVGDIFIEKLMASKKY